MSRSVALLLLAVLVAAPAARAADPREDAVRLNEQGIAALDAGEFESAIDLFTRARSSLPLDVTLRTNLATARSRYGSALLGEDRLEDAIRQFRLAVSLSPTSAVHQANLGISLVRAGQSDEGRKSLEKACILDRDFGPALTELGAIAYRDGDLRKAIEYWNRAVAAGPERADLTRALARAKREYEVEKTHRTLDSAHFSISFDGDRDAGVGDRILTILEDAYGRVAADLGIEPRERTRVILYTGEEFQDVTGAHAWVGGLFDGRIRIPVKDFVRAEDEVRDTIFHEYVHVAVRSLTDRCPAWLNEGLAQVYEGRLARGVAALLAAARKSDGLLTLKELDPTFTRFADVERARLAYAMALSLTSSLLDDFGPDRVGVFLKAISEGRTTDAAARAAFYRPLDEVYAEWVSGL